MYIIANCSTIQCWVIGAEYLNCGPQARSSVKDQRNEMGLGLVIFADLARRVGTYGIEVAQPHRLQPVSTPKVIHHPLTNELGKPVRIDRVQRRILVDWHLVRLAIYRAG